MMAAGVAMRDQHRVCAVRGEPPVGFVGDVDLGHDGAVLQAKVADPEIAVLDDANVGGSGGGCG
jgi:hypothetical protein